MPSYAKEPAHTQSTPSQPGILLINLGTPEAPTRGAVRAYLKEFLSDPRVIEIPRFIWWPVLNFFVLTTRPKASAARYERIWTHEGSPLRIHTERQTTLLRGYLGERFRVPFVVDYAMRYGTPSIAEKLDTLKARGCDRVLLLPLYPQYSASTTASAFDAAYAALAHMRNQPETRTIRHFHDDSGYIEALAQSVRDEWAKRGRPNFLVMSFHGVPRRTVDLGDPYYSQCQTTGRLLAEVLGLEADQYRITFQSRFGRARWLEPYTVQVLEELGRRNLERVDVICPGFVADCLETLEEISIEGTSIFLRAGGRELHYISCLNERHEWIHALTDLAARNLLGWMETGPTGAPESARLRAFSGDAQA